MVDPILLQEKYKGHAGIIFQDEHKLLYTSELYLANHFRVKDPSPVNFIKDPRARKYYEVHGKRSNLYTKVGSRYYLPGSVYNCNPKNPHPRCKENLYDRQYEAVKELLSFTTKGGILISGTGTGKALANSEKALTPTGRVEMGVLKIGDLVYSSDGHTTEVIGVYPQGLRQTYKVIFIDGTEVIADGDHLWEVTTSHLTRKGLTKIVTTKEMLDDPYFSRISPEGWKKNKYQVYLPKPIQFPKKELYIPPYTLGAIIGDGSLSNGLPVITTPDQEIVNKINSEINPLGYYLSLWVSAGITYSFRFIKHKKISKITLDLKELGLIGTKSATKFIPKKYLYSSVEDRLNLLRGLMDTDGTIDKSGCISYTTNSKVLINQIKELVQGLGGLALSITDRRAKGATGLSYTLYFSIKYNPFYLAKKSERFLKRKTNRSYKAITDIQVHTVQECTCIKVDHPSHLFITSGYTPTHNTRCLAGTCYSVGKSILLTPTDIISNNVVEEFTKFGLHAIKLNGKQKEIPDCDVLVMHISTFKLNYKELVASNYNTVLQDECFVKGTLVDGTPIENIKVGDYVRSFNHITNTIEYKRVINIFKTNPKGNLVKIVYNDGKTIISTEAHPFWDGFEYSTKKSIDMMLYIINQNNERIASKLHLVLKRICLFCRLQNSLLQTTLKNILFNGLFSSVQSKNIFSNCSKYKPQICFGQDEEKQSNVQSTNQRESFFIIKENLTQAKNSVMKLKMINYPTGKACIISFRSRMRICISNLISFFQLNISNSLQNRYSKSIQKDSDGNGLIKSQYSGKEETRSKENTLFRRQRVESVKIYKQTSDGKFGGLCPDGYVYNIEVEDNHNYFVGEGILVHNCHHLSTPLLKLYNLWPGRIYGFTATPSRQEYLLDGFNIAMGKSVDTKITALPVIVRPIAYAGKYTVEQAVKAHEGLSPDSYEYIRNLLYQDSTRIEIVNSLITKLLENGKNKIIVFSDRVEHAKDMYDRFQKTGLAKSYLILGEVNDKASLIEEIKTQQQFVIFGTIGCTGEGMDVPMLEVGILTFNSKEERIIQQAVGRVRRKYGEKTCGIFFDIQDSLEIEGSRKKYLGGTARNKIYHSLGFDVKEPIGQGTIIGWYPNSQTT